MYLSKLRCRLLDCIQSSVSSRLFLTTCITCPLTNYSHYEKDSHCTGATGGIGQIVCKSLVIAGADIVSIQIPKDGHGESLSRSISEIGRKLWISKYNLTDPSSIRSTFQYLASRNQAFLFLNCAGVNRKGPITEVTGDYLDRTQFQGTNSATDQIYGLLLEFQPDLRCPFIIQVTKCVYRNVVTDSRFSY